MATGSGLDGQLAFAPETSYGTRVTPNRAFEYDSESVKMSKARLTSQGIHAGRWFPRGSRSVQTTRDVSGDVTFDVPSVGFGPVLNQLHGNVVTPVQEAATTAYLQTHNVGLVGSRGKSMSGQFGKPDTSTGTVHAFDYVGLKILTFRLAFDVGGFLKCTLTLDGRDELADANALITPSYGANLRSFDFTQGAVLTTGTADIVAAIAAAGTSLGNITGGNFELNQPMKTDRYFLGSNGLKAEPLQNAFGSATANFDMEFSSLTPYNRFINNTSFDVLLKFEGATIASTYKEALYVFLPYCVVDGETPSNAGAEVLNMSYPVMVQDPGGAGVPIQIAYRSTDVTL